MDPVDTGSGPAAVTDADRAEAADWHTAVSVRPHYAPCVHPDNPCSCGAEQDRHAIAAALAAERAAAEERGYERGRRDFQFQPSGDNHHNAALCPYCSPPAERATADQLRADVLALAEEWCNATDESGQPHSYFNYCAKRLLAVAGGQPCTVAETIGEAT
jgi:hypothetical protein